MCSKIRNNGKLVKIGIFSTILITILIVAVCLYVYLPRQQVCYTPTCVIEAANILKSIDTSVSPCDNFYQFATGQLNKDITLPDDKSSVSQFSLLQDQLNNKIKGLITGIDVKTEKREFVRNVKNYYESCYNTTLLEELGDRPLRNLLDGWGGWPVIVRESWKGIRWDDLLIRMFDEGYEVKALFTWAVWPDAKNNSRRVLTLFQPSFYPLSRETILKGTDEPIVKAYKQLMEKTVTKLGVNPFGNSKALLDIENIFTLETRLANNTMPQEQRRNVSAIYAKMTIWQLAKIAPNINWLKIFKATVSSSINTEEVVVVLDTNYIKTLNSIIFTNENELFVNLLIWKAIIPTMTSLNEEWHRIIDEFWFAAKGIRSRSPRSEICIKQANRFHHAMSHLYVNEFFSHGDKDNAMAIIRYIHSQFERTLKDNQLLSGETRNEALKKLSKMRHLVGYPAQLTDVNNLEEFYKNLRLMVTDYFGNNARVTKWLSQYQFHKLRQPVDVDDWRDNSFVAVVNAFYNRIKNQMTIPAGVLQGVFFNKDRPNYLNYGGIGSSVGHEITHGFDDGGRQFDSEGILRNWWDSSADRLYASKAQCFIDQYSNFFAEEVGMHLNGIVTQGENIADNGGFAQVFKAYRQFVADNGPEPRLPGVDYTPEQLVWISYAIKYFNKETNESLKIRILSYPHSPNKFRINGVAMNSPEFSVLFNCPVDSPMNPKNKCKLW